MCTNEISELGWDASVSVSGMEGFIEFGCIKGCGHLLLVCIGVVLMDILW